MFYIIGEAVGSCDSHLIREIIGMKYLNIHMDFDINYTVFQDSTL